MYHLKIFEDHKEVLTIAAMKHKIFHDRLPGGSDIFRFINIRGIILQVSTDPVRKMIRQQYYPCDVAFYENDIIVFKEKCIITILQPITPIRWQLGLSIIFKARMFNTTPIYHVS